MQLSPGTPWNFLGVRLQYFPSWQEHRAQASVPASSVYQLSGKHTVWFQKDCCQLGRKVNKVKPEDCLSGGRQTTTPPEHVPALLWNSEVKPLSLVPEDLRESQDTHSRHTSLLSRKLLRQPSKSVRASRDRGIT